MDMNNDVNHPIALRALGWEPLKTERKKAKAKMMYKVLNKISQITTFGKFQMVLVYWSAIVD
jgi:hypothetical protein